MISKRIIPCLDVKDGRVVKGVQFLNLRDAGDPVEIAKKYKIYVIEDAAQAHGAEYKGVRSGTQGHLACFSFYPGKNLGAYGDAGAVTSNDTSLLDRIRALRNHGRTSKYAHKEIGYGERIDALQALQSGN